MVPIKFSDIALLFSFVLNSKIMLIQMMMDILMLLLRLQLKKEVKEEGQTLKPKKVVLKQQPKEEPKQEPKQEEDEGDSQVVSEKRTVKIVEENGKKKKMIKVVKTLKDGSKEVEKFYQDYKEGEDDDDD